MTAAKYIAASRPNNHCTPGVSETRSRCRKIFMVQPPNKFFHHERGGGGGRWAADCFSRSAISGGTAVCTASNRSSSSELENSFAASGCVCCSATCSCFWESLVCCFIFSLLKRFFQN